ncbi:MAG TPA: Gfo/Idh/MocA family oxidoreductase [Tepidisphaeraceae bacterium]|nr:Gfo/Idh/MocA family oxidoreductase [Tepidisphaeraceae bacterium]
MRYIIVGTSGPGVAWCRLTLPKLLQLNKATPVAAVDSNLDSLRNAQECLGVAPQHCFTDVSEAFDARRADFALILSSSNEHEKLVNMAVEHDLHVLIDGPLADTMPAACRIYKRIRDSDKKLAVITTPRFDQDKQTLMKLVQAKQYGRLNYIMARSLYNRKQKGTWGRHRYGMQNPILVEEAVHHFDMLRAMSGGEAKTVQAVSWNLPWSDFQGDSNALVAIEMNNDVHCLYEGAVANASTLNSWTHEYVRAECELGTLELDRRRLRLLKGESGEEPRVAELPLNDQPLTANQWIVDQFCEYVNDATKPANRLKENFASVALTFAAVEATRTGKAVDVKEFTKREFSAA